MARSAKRPRPPHDTQRASLPPTTTEVVVHYLEEAASNISAAAAVIQKQKPSSGLLVRLAKINRALLAILRFLDPKHRNY